MTTQRITGSIPVLCLIALASFFTLTFSAIPEVPEDSLKWFRCRPQCLRVCLGWRVYFEPEPRILAAFR